ncbi:MAG: biotin--[acetyl-CoA-carboxylase] ligase [Saprospiraceae bacterium]
MSVTNTLFIGKNFIQFPELASTNAAAQELLTTTKPSEGTVITAVRQSAGRGQAGSQWESEAGKNVTMSVILYPHFLVVQQQFWLNRAITLGVRDTIAKLLGQSVKLKWPNDIYIKDKKVAGILIQNSLLGAKIQASIIGIGLNVNQTVFLSDAPNPTSLQLESQHSFDLPEVIQMLCQQIELRYLQLRGHKYSFLAADYLRHLYRYQQPAVFRGSDGMTFNGQIIGVTDIGQLCIQKEDGQLQRYMFKEVAHVI